MKPKTTKDTLKVKQTKTIEDLTKTYTKNMNSKTVRLYGRESEYPLVSLNPHRYGEGILADDIEKVFQDMNKEYGWNQILDPETRRVIAVDAKIKHQIVNIGTDFGACTLEIAYAPNKTLKETEDQCNEVLGKVNKILKENNIALLGYGIQPISAPDTKLLAAKGRAATLESRFYTKEKLNGHNTDVHYHTINASEQIHIDVSKKEAIRVMNMLNTLTPLLISLYGNSGVWLGKIDQEHNDPRERFWDWVVNIPQDKKRKGIPKQFKNIDDYLNTILEFQPVMTVRKGEDQIEYVEFQGLNSMKEYLIEKGKGKVIKPGTRKNPQINHQVGEYISATDLDLGVHDSFVWYDNRLKSLYGTVESRVIAQQPIKDQMTPIALLKGLTENLNTIEKYIKYELPNEFKENLSKYRNYSIEKGMKYTIEDISVKKYLYDILDIANSGLEIVGEQTQYLKPLYERLEKEKNPSDEIKDVYSRKGIKGLIQERKL